MITRLHRLGLTKPFRWLPLRIWFITRDVITERQQGISLIFGTIGSLALRGTERCQTCLELVSVTSSRAHSHFHKRGHPLQKDSMLRTFTSNNKSMVITLWKGKMYRERVISLIININNEINGGVWNCVTLLHGHEGENNYKCLL